MTEEIATSKICLSCDRRTQWSRWFCPACGGRLTSATHEAPKELKGRNNVVVIMNDTKKVITIDIPPHERMRLEYGQLANIPTANDENVFIRIKDDDTILVGTKMYTEN